jgi:hypothetical protein
MNDTNKAPLAGGAYRPPPPGRIDPPRIVHLLGGLRAHDFGDKNVSVSVDARRPLLHFPRPQYPSLYARLEQIGLRPIGVEIFSSQDELDGIAPTHWVPWRTPEGLRGVQIQREWSNVHHQAVRSGDRVVGRCSEKLRTYIRLLHHRLLQLSNAYNALFRYQQRSKNAPAPDHVFSNVWMDELVAAIHGFLADAAAMRDALVEATWLLALKRPDKDVPAIGSFLKQAKDETHPLALDILREGKPGGWIKNLTDLRNEVTHVAPVSTTHEISGCESRELKLQGGSVLGMHYPLTTQDWALRRDVDRTVDYNDEESLKRSMAAYKEFSATSGDALEYAWRTLSNLTTLAEAVRLAAGLSAPMLVLTDKDIMDLKVITPGDPQA